jgi:hypothetical protein
MAARLSAVFMRNWYHPQRSFPYDDLGKTNRGRSRKEMEYEPLDIGAFADDPARAAAPLVPQHLMDGARHAPAGSAGGHGTQGRGGVG